MGHSNCGAVSTAVHLAAKGESSCESVGCSHLDLVIGDIQISIPPQDLIHWDKLPNKAKQNIIDEVARRNARHSARTIYEESQSLANLADQGKIAIVAAMYDLEHGTIELLESIGAPIQSIS
jgi:carbonic anhydrase/SulP family sulfate permease